MNSGAAPQAGNTLKLAVVAMVRNEADIMGAFLKHCTALFDALYIVNHQSTDGTRELLAEAKANGAPLEIYDYAFKQHFKTPISNTLARHAFREGADWVFFLDADEFLAVRDRQELQSILPEAESCFFRWRNLAPVNFGTFEQFTLAGDYLSLTTQSNYRKVALSRHAFQRFPDFHVTLGNHWVQRTPYGEAISGGQAGELFHIPIRSLARLSLKVRGGAAARRAVTIRRKNHSPHWFRMEELISAGRLDERALKMVALGYGTEAMDFQGPWPDCETVTPVIPVSGLVLRTGSRRPEDVEARESSLPWAEWPYRTGDRGTIATLQDGQIALTRAPPLTRFLETIRYESARIRGLVRRS